MNDQALLPEADIDSFLQWVRSEYTDNRWSEAYRRNHSVTVWSGKHPAFGRFQQDLRPHLHEHGLVIAETRTNVPKKIDGEMEKVHWISAIPVAKAVAPALDMQCGRHSCTNVIENASSEYCEGCAPIFDGE